jgi:CheY-like chemotaxis protein
VRTIVVVDDNDNNLLLEKDLLEVAGYRVFTAMTATDGLELIRKVLPDLIVMDVWLPDMFGTEAAMMLHKSPDTRDIPVIFVTASALPQSRQAREDLPKSGFIGKPINTRRFALEVGSYLPPEVV